MKNSGQKTLFASLALAAIFTLSACGPTASNPVTTSQPSVTSSTPVVTSNPTSTTVVSSTSEKEVSKVAIAKTPDKTNYFLDNSADSVLDLTGGQIEVTFSDSSKKTFAMSDEGVSVVSPDLTSAGEKSVVVRYGGSKRANQTTYRVSVLKSGAKLTFNLNYAGTTSIVREFVLKTAGSPIATPTRTGYQFENWYQDAKGTLRFDFTSALTGNVELFAQWKQDGHTYHEVTFDLNYYGIKPQNYPQIVEDGKAAIVPEISTARDGFTFAGWFSDEALTNAFVATSEIKADARIYAKWNRVSPSVATYLFEAEKTNLNGKTGPGYSGSATGSAMIGKSTTIGASGDAYVSYLFQKNLSLEFDLGSSEAVTDASITVRCALESQLGLATLSLNQKVFGVMVNGLSYDYAAELKSGENFSDAISISNVSLKAGANRIQLITLNDGSGYSLGGTYQAVAPNIDCVKVASSSVLIWDANKGLPMEY